MRINQAVILESPDTNNSPGGTLPKDCGEKISVMYDIVPSERNMATWNFVRRRVKYFGESYAPGGLAALTRCRLIRQQCHYAFNGSTFLRINGNSDYPCDPAAGGETVLDYLYELSFGFSNYKYDPIAGRLNPLTRGPRAAAQNYALASCVNDFINNRACGQYVFRPRTIDMHLSIVSGNEIGSVTDDPLMGRRFLTNYNATMVLRNN